LHDKRSHDGRSRGKIIIRAEEIKFSRDIIFMQLCAHHVDKMDFLGKSDPYLFIYRLRENGEAIKVWSTEVIKNTLDPM